MSSNFEEEGSCPKVTCQMVLDCIAMPTAACCGNTGADFNTGQAMACQAAGFSTSVPPCASGMGTGVGAGGGTVADGGF